MASNGIMITASEATDLAMHRDLCLRDNERIEFGTPAVVAIAKELALSSCLKTCDAADALTRLQEVFYRTRDEPDKGRAFRRGARLGDYRDHLPLLR